MRRLSLVATVFAWGLLSIGSVQSAVLIAAIEDSGDVTFSGSGSINLAGLTPGADGFALGGSIIPNGSDLRFSLSNIDIYPGAMVPAPFGSGGKSLANLVSGDNFGFDFLGNLGVPHQYESGDPLSFSMTFELATFASLGLVAGTYVWNLPNDTITLVVGANPVPLPAALPLFASVLLGGGALAWRRRKAKPANTWPFRIPARRSATPARAARRPSRL